MPKLTLFEFNKILSEEESAFVDFKYECKAFGKGNEVETGELVKDIIAFSNNGNRKGLLIIGVSNNRKNFKSVENSKLTDDNIQTLVRDAIFPTPVVKLYEIEWNDAEEDIRNKKFIVIQIGPQARQCFRFAKEYINYDKKQCFKKNEVWIRRQATSDLASPEEIKRLLEHKEPIQYEALDENIDYSRLARAEALSAIHKDLSKQLSRIGGNVEIWSYFSESGKERKQAIATIPFLGDSIKLACIIVEKIDDIPLLVGLCSRLDVISHGLLLVCMNNTPSGFFKLCNHKIKNNWGYFSTVPYSKIEKFVNNLPTNVNKTGDNKGPNYFAAIMSNVKSTQQLAIKLNQMLLSFNNESDIEKLIVGFSDFVTSEICKWRKYNCPVKTGKFYNDGSLRPNLANYTKKINQGQFILAEICGNEILQENKQIIDFIDKFGFCKEAPN